MARKSDTRRDRLISATAASRSFSRLLDDVESGRRFLVHRHGRVVCLMTPPPVQRRRATECLALLRGRASVSLDDGFSTDLLNKLAEEIAEERPDWES